jgi:hypothetical protein
MKVVVEKTDTTKVRVKDIPLSADDGQIIKALEDHNCEIVKFFRERLRIDNYTHLCCISFFFECIPGISCVKVYRFVSKHQGR